MTRWTAEGNASDCNAWTFGEPRTGHLDARWYCVAADGGWVASARVNGNAPGTNPLP